MPLNDLPNFNNQPSANNLADELRSFPPAKVNEADRKKLKQIYISLILIGLAIGGVLSVVIILALNRFGLTARPEPAEQSSLPFQRP